MTQERSADAKLTKTRRYLIRVLFFSAPVILCVLLVSIGILLDKHFHPGYRPEFFVVKNGRGKASHRKSSASPTNFRNGVVADDDIEGNHIVLQVNDNGELTIAPQVGDLIEWQAVDFDDQNETIHPLVVKFTGKSLPCDLTTDQSEIPTTGFCNVDSDIENATYRYKCSTQDGQTKCVDPALGPRSRSGRSLTSEASYYNVEEIEDVGIGLGCALLRIHDCPVKPPSKVVRDNLLVLGDGAAEVRTTTPAPIAVKLAMAIPQEHDAQVSCENNIATITPDTGSTTTTASSGDTIYWTSTKGALTFGYADHPTSMQIPFGGGKSCAVQKLSLAKNTWECVVPVDVSNVNVDYTVQDADNACNANHSATGRINVP